jgi:hypothetical protein
LESAEQIISVLFAVWGTEEGFFKRGREGMLILTSKRIAFVSKTKMNINWWRDEVERQIKDFKQSINTIRVSDEYTLERLSKDLEEEGNLNIPLRQVASIGSEDKGWGSEMKVKFMIDGKDKTYKLAMVKGWATYPIKDPISFLYVNWQPWINAARSYM